MGRHLFFYMGRLFVRCFMGIIGFFALFVFILDFFEFQRRVTSASALSFGQKAGLLCLKAPFVLEQLLPFLMFLAALSLLWRLNRGNEVLILRSFGLSAWWIASPFFIVALAFGFLNLMVLQPASVSLFKMYQKRETRLLQKSTQDVMQVSSSGFWLKKKNQDYQVIYRIQNMQQQTRRIEGVSIYLFDAHYRFEKRYEAREGRLEKEGLSLKDVWVLPAEQLGFHQSELTLPLHLSLKDLYQHSPSAQLISFWSFPSLIRWMNQAGMSPYKYKLEQQRLWAVTFWFGALVFLAVACGIRPQKRGGTLLLLSFGVAASLILYFIRDITYALASARYLPMIFATWSPCVLTFLMALILLFFWEESQRS